MSEKTRRDKTLKLIEDGDDDDWKTAVFILPSTSQTLTITFIDKNHFQKAGRSVC